MKKDEEQMHQYLKAIGFDNINTRYDLKDLMEDVEAGFTHQTIVSYRPGEDFCELRREYGQCIGVSLCGELDDDDNFYPDYYFPYFEGSGISTYADIAIERKIEKEQYVGMCEDSKIGISLIFTLQNGIEYMRERQAGFTAGVTTSVTLSGLTAREACDELARLTRSEPVQVIGTKFVLYRQHYDKAKRKIQLVKAGSRTRAD